MQGYLELSGHNCMFIAGLAIINRRTQILIFRQTERATTDQRPRMESSCPGASIGVGISFMFSFFGKIILKNR